MTPTNDRIHDAMTFLTVLFAFYANDPALRLEIRPAIPAWLKSVLYPNHDAPDNWQFRTRSGMRAWFPLTGQGLALAAQHALSERFEVYFGVLPRMGYTGKAVDVPAAACLWCDIDGGFEGVAGALARLDAAVQAGRLPPPDCIVVSGNGLHVYWRLAAPVPFPHEMERYRFKQTLHRLCHVIGGVSHTAHADTSRADVASILRVPGTFNRKLEQEPRAVTLLPTAPDEPHTLTWWNANLPALPVPPPPKYPKPDLSNLAAYEGLLRWARRPYPEGKRHKDLVAAAAWLVRTVGLEKPLALELLMLKAQVSAGMRQITPEELEAMIRWA